MLFNCVPLISEAGRPGRFIFDVLSFCDACEKEDTGDGDDDDKEGGGGEQAETVSLAEAVLPVLAAAVVLLERLETVVLFDSRL